MKNLYILLCLTFWFTGIIAQAPQAFKYQAVVRDASGNLVSTQSVPLRLRNLDGVPNGTFLYNEVRDDPLIHNWEDQPGKKRAVKIFCVREASYSVRNHKVIQNQPGGIMK